jgi:FMN phosphatase YigB (HAD superfamily)
MSAEIKLVAFNLVGTVIKDIFSHARGHLHVDANQKWDEAEQEADFIHSFDYRAVFRSWLQRNADRLVESLYQQFRDFLVEHALDYVYPDAIEVLKVLSDRGIKLGFVTDGSRDIEGRIIEAILRHCGIDPADCIIVTSEEVGCGKGEVEPFRALIMRAKALGIKQENIEFVGDKPAVDINGAKKAGLRATLIVRRPQPGDSRPDRQIDNLLDLLSDSKNTSEGGG